jgi:hypothetical protein
MERGNGKIGSRKSREYLFPGMEYVDTNHLREQICCICKYSSIVLYFQSKITPKN